jgi:GT2 family glycosyltransferase
MDVSILIVNYNTGVLLNQLMHSIEKHFKGFTYEVIIVDNDSSDISKDILLKLEKEKKAKVLLLEKNYGFARANNVGFKDIKGKFLVLLNPDTIFVENSIEKVMEFRNRLAQPAIIGIKLIYEDGTLQHSKSIFPNLKDSFFQAVFLDSLFKKSSIFNRIYYGWQDENQTVSVDSIRGAFMFMDKDIFQILNGFDEDFFLYTEETDLCFRAHNRNIPVYYYPDTRLIHLEGRSMDLKRLNTFIELYKSKILFVRKHKGIIPSLIFKFILALAAFNRVILNGVLSLLKRHPFYKNKFKLYWYSFLWFLGFSIKRLNRQVKLFNP